MAEKSASGREQATVVCRKIPVTVYPLLRGQLLHYADACPVVHVRIVYTIIHQASDWLVVLFAHTLGQYNFPADAGYRTQNCKVSSPPRTIIEIGPSADCIWLMKKIYHGPNCTLALNDTNVRDTGKGVPKKFTTH